MTLQLILSKDSGEEQQKRRIKTHRAVSSETITPIGPIILHRSTV